MTLKLWIRKCEVASISESGHRLTLDEIDLVKKTWKKASCKQVIELRKENTFDKVFKVIKWLCTNINTEYIEESDIKRMREITKEYLEKIT